MAMTKAEKAAVDALKMKLALRWPDVAMPKPLFWFGDYDKLFGADERTVEMGTYFVAHGRYVHRVVLSLNTSSWKRFAFDGKDSVQRGAYYRDEADARLHVLWDECTDAARTLKRQWDAYEIALAAREADPS